MSDKIKSTHVIICILVMAIIVMSVLLGNKDKNDAKIYDSKTYLKNQQQNMFQNQNPNNFDAPPDYDRILEQRVIENVSKLTWDDIAGLEEEKKAIQEMVVWPSLRPELFTGIMTPEKGFLLFGPPGTGKTMIAKCIASQLKSTFISISASDLASKYYGDSEKLVSALFRLAKRRQPSIIFFDEIDSVLGKRNSNEHEISRKIKTEFLIQMDGVGSSSTDRITFIAATNRPDDIDEAVLRRFQKKIYIPLPSRSGREQLVKNLLKETPYELSEKDFETLVNLTDGYSGSDLANVCREAAKAPIREFKSIQMIKGPLRPLKLSDFENALKQIRPSVSIQAIFSSLHWNKDNGAFWNDQLEKQYQEFMSKTIK
ncbi:AAA-domain-containing protein [Rozella allomycis CSF55]|uniref:AAA-domain-containing protein n=1 Tax=Rozella allomycis (strain CSF55) TaxID=988480 RepID=A0A075ASI5_ROZAC|nr:ATPase, AAA-type domain-containing protein [Rozella allomycis CSF55]RKP20051.1 AAA-domain-containing protein [Rozella allomycis CSF55]|eukprot:EPZ33246.1 ATPase, AAA-type domain-containing protein [Rozella allomycis CSF55]